MLVKSLCWVCAVCEVRISRSLCIGLGVMFVHVMCNQCVVVWLQRIDVWDLVFMYWLHKDHCHLPPGPGFCSTSPLRSSWATSQPAGGWAPKKKENFGPHFGWQGEGVINPLFWEGYPTVHRPPHLAHLHRMPQLHWCKTSYLCMVLPLLISRSLIYWKMIITRLTNFLDSCTQWTFFARFSLMKHLFFNGRTFPLSYLMFVSCTQDPDGTLVNNNH